MTWLKCKITTTHAAIDAIGQVLEQFNIVGFQIETPTRKNNQDQSSDEVFMLFYVENKEEMEARLQEIHLKVKELEDSYGIDIGSGDLYVEQLSDGWQTAWKKYYEPINVSEQMMIVPTWKKSTVDKSGKLVIELDPGLAFGTGSHPSTFLSLEALEKYVDRDQTVIDVGSGSGILSIACLLLGAKHVTAIDNDPQAIKSTQQNAALNQVDQNLTILQGNLLKSLEEQADLIVANILAEVIVTFVDDAYDRLKPGGYFISSGIIKRKQGLVENALKQASFTIIEVFDADQWVCIVAEKR